MRTTEAVKYQRGEVAHMKRVAYAALVFLAGVLFPVLIWVALFAAIREPLLQAVRRVAHAVFFFLVGIFMPVLIWVVFAVAIRELWLRWREEWLPSTMVCPIGIGCQSGSICAAGRPGYICIAGRCVPQY